ncbi:hypothetical protein FSP39_013469 [Pinctada imbricata]|uniref:Uncharacterized protein n=1 Tax=Pinctada imbricata TaxID=66713 RepID=A0AA89BZC0_PINIB|nr:hypothetical protein FSP39_013469 [Pinctada imbricata]
MGDPHYKTYDGQWIHFQGICKYVLTELSDHDDPCWFSVSVKNENRGSKRVSFTRLVDIQLPYTKLRLRKGRKLEVNGVRYYLPYERQGKFRVFRSGSYIRVETSCGIVVTWNGISTVSVMVPVKYGNKLRGICGNCNQRKDDYKTKNGKDVSRYSNKFNLIGESWRIRDDSGINQCTPPRPPPVCTHRERRLASKNNACGFLNPKNTRSPFLRCIRGNAVLAKEFYYNCLYDYCTYCGKPKEELQKVVCNGIEGFAEACKDRGMTIKWRRNTFCPMKCGANQVYNYKATGCPATCVDPNAPKTCSLPKAEGCECKRGYILSDDQCVKTSSCGCYHRGRYLPVGTVIKGCYEELHCKNTGHKAHLIVADIRCSNYSVCKLTNGQYKCICRNGYIGDGLTCKPKASRTTVICEHKSNALSCPAGHLIKIASANYGRTSKGTCRSSLDRDTNCKASKSLSIVKSICDGNNACSLEATNSVFGDPCVGTYKYLTVVYNCYKSDEKSLVICEHKSDSLSCPEGKKLEVVSANYGRTAPSSKGTCPTSLDKNTNCRASKSLSIVQSQCEGKSTCSLRASNGVYGDPCVGTYKYLRVVYKCSSGGCDDDPAVIA